MTNCQANPDVGSVRDLQVVGVLGIDATRTEVMVKVRILRQYTRNLRPGRVARTNRPITNRFYAKAWIPYSQLDRQGRRLVLEYEQEETDL